MFDLVTMSKCKTPMVCTVRFFLLIVLIECTSRSHRMAMSHTRYMRPFGQSDILSLIEASAVWQRKSAKFFGASRNDFLRNLSSRRERKCLLREHQSPVDVFDESCFLPPSIGVSSSLSTYLSFFSLGFPTRVLLFSH